MKVKDGVTMVEMQGLAAHLSYENRAKVMGIFVLSTCLINVVLPVQVYFRFYTLKTFQFLTTRMSLLLFIIAILSCCPAGLSCWQTYQWSASERAGFNFATLWYDEVPVPNLLVGDIRSIHHKLYFLLGASAVVTGYCLVLYYAYQTHRILKAKAAGLSEKTKRLQMQLSRFLTTQVLTHLVVYEVPVFWMIVSVMFRCDTGHHGYLMNIALSSLPIINPLMTLIIIGPYRRSIIGAFCCNKKRIFSQASFQQSQRLSTLNQQIT
ncbi:unnamed protein product [Bursaphelenchus xylophilus]|uniref:(pine wood nematode) hypothetical protein n=1 Tax=Bursaphelenchus xylophilus TaxID=6326 RepID=A0A1I7RJQ4_BURXY|nr:unnamed protein product [Bursaphelenchus xylophilus]CAG9128986.1 unnamed protein product [Bursaphelenchus xylophilus]